MINIVEDVSTLTTIPEKALNKLITKTIYCICDAVAEARITKQDIVNLDIGIGTLNLMFTADSIKYKFIPSEKFESDLKNVFLDGQNLLEDVLDTSLVNKVTNVYKDLI